MLVFIVVVDLLLMVDGEWFVVNGFCAVFSEWLTRLGTWTFAESTLLSSRTCCFNLNSVGALCFRLNPDC